MNPQQFKVGYDLTEKHTEALCALYYVVRRLGVTAIAADIKEHVSQSQVELGASFRRLVTFGLVVSGWTARYTGRTARALERCRKYELTEEGLRVARILSPYAVSRVF